MNEFEIIAIYQEMLVSLEKIESSGHTLSAHKQMQLAEIKDITDALKKKAETFGFGDKMVAADHDIVIDPSDDLRQLIASSICSLNLKSIMQSSLELYLDTHSENGKVGRKRVWEAVQILDKYYNANVLSVSSTNINEKMQGAWKQIYGDSLKDLDILAAAHQKSAEEALAKEIKSLAAKGWVASIVRLDNYFEAAIKGKKSWVEATVASVAALGNHTNPQLKIDLREFKLPANMTDFKFLNFKFSKGKAQISGKLGLKKPVLFSHQKAVIEDHLNYFIKSVRNTVTISSLFNKDKGTKIGGSTTLLSRGLTIPITDYLTLTTKFDLGKMSWNSLPTTEALLSAKFAVQGTIDLKKLMKDEQIKGTALDNSFSKITISIAWDISIDWSETYKTRAKIQAAVTAKRKAKRAAQIKKGTDVIKKEASKLFSLANDNSVLKKINTFKKGISTKADEILDAINNKTFGKIKSAGKEMAEKAQKAYDLLENTEWFDKTIQSQAKNALNKLGNTVFNKLSGPIKTFSKVMKYGKFAGKLVPGLNAIIMAVEIGFLAYDIIVYLENNPQMSFEDHVIAGGKFFAESFVGGWFKSLDGYMLSLK